MSGLCASVTPLDGVTLVPVLCPVEKKSTETQGGDETTAVTWHQRRLICSPQFCLSRNSALPHRVSASYGGRQPQYSAVQPVQVMTTRRRFSQVTETLARRHPKALLSACCSSLATLVQDYHLLSRHPSQRSLFTQWRDIPFTTPPRLYG